MIYTGSELGKMICTALNLDPDGIRKISIECEAGEIATVTIELIKYDGDGLIASLKKYDLVSRPTDA